MSARFGEWAAHGLAQCRRRLLRHDTRRTSRPSPPPSRGSRRAGPGRSPARPAWRASSRSTIPPPGNAFVNVGERTNVTGSRTFARLVADGPFETRPWTIAREQVENGAQVIDINMDEAMLDRRRGHDPLPAT